MSQQVEAAVTRRIPTTSPVSLVRAGTVVTTDPLGRFEPGTYHGLYHGDRRLLSRYELTVDGAEPTVLRASRRGPSDLDVAAATAFDVHGDAHGVLVLHRQVTGGVTDRYQLHRLRPGPPLRLVVALATDLADLLAVKAGLVPSAVYLPRRLGPGRFALGPALAASPPDGQLDDRSDGQGDDRLDVEVVGPEPQLSDDGLLVWDVDPEPGRPWTLCLTLTPAAVGRAAGRSTPAPTHHRETAAVAAGAAIEAGPGEVDAHLVVAADDHRWPRAIAAAVADLDSLRIEQGGERYIAAGAPWFMALFGRDALLTAYAALPLGTDVVLDLLEALARRQGRRHDQSSLEQPGRILHELRTGGTGVFGLPPGTAYYGTTDATPLFVMLLAEAWRWGADPTRVAGLVPAARSAVAWCLEHGDIDGDGFIESVPDPAAIANQGWKDSGDSMVHADGSEATPPIALVEVQAYLHAALVGLAALEEAFGDPDAAAPLRAQAARLADHFVASFLDDAMGGLVLGLDADKRPLAVPTSNMGHALWAQALPPAVATRIAARVSAPDLAAHWGIRTLGAEAVAYSPLAYHRGTIWPHDTAFVAHGLQRSGSQAPLRRVIDGSLDLAERFGYRLPELLGGLDRDELAEPVPYPVACSPQAWSAAAPLLLLRAALGLEPDVPARRLALAPTLPPDGWLHVTGLRVADRTLTIRASADGVEVEGADDWQVEVRSPE